MSMVEVQETLLPSSLYLAYTLGEVILSTHWRALTSCGLRYEPGILVNIYTTPNYTIVGAPYSSHSSTKSRSPLARTHCLEVGALTRR